MGAPYLIYIFRSFFYVLCNCARLYMSLLWFKGNTLFWWVLAMSSVQFYCIARQQFVAINWNLLKVSKLFEHKFPLAFITFFQPFFSLKNAGEGSQGTMYSACLYIIKLYFTQNVLPAGCWIFLLTSFLSWWLHPQS